MAEPRVQSRWLTSERLLLAGLLLFTLLVRGGVLWAMRDNLHDDPDMYREIAENLLNCGDFARGKGGCEAVRTTAYRPPLYPVVLSNLPAAGGTQVSLIKVAVLHVLLGLATVWLVWLTGRRLIGGTMSAVAASVLVACDPILLNQQTLVMTETLAAFLAILSLWCLVRHDGRPSAFNAALAGGAIGLAILCRPTFLPWLALVAAVMVLVPVQNSVLRFQNSEGGAGNRRLAKWGGGVGWRVANGAALAVIAAAMVSPWVIRNYREFGKPIATTTHGGYTLELGNNADFYGWLLNDKSGMPWDSRSFDFDYVVDAIQLLESLPWHDYDDPEEAGVELLMDSRAYERAFQTAREQPRVFALACGYRAFQLWSPLPHKLSADESTGRRLLRYATAAWYCGVYALAAVGIWRLRWKLLARPWLWGVLLCLTFTAVHTLYWSNLRMRGPLMPFIALVAAAALAPKSTAADTASRQDL